MNLVMLYILLVLNPETATLVARRGPMPAVICQAEAAHLNRNAAVGGYPMQADCVPVVSEGD